MILPSSEEHNFGEEYSGWDSTTEEEKEDELVPAIWEFITILRDKHRGNLAFLNAIQQVDPRIAGCKVDTNIFVAVRLRRKRLTYRLDCSGINHQSKAMLNHSLSPKRRYTLG